MSGNGKITFELGFNLWIEGWILTMRKLYFHKVN